MYINSLEMTNFRNYVKQKIMFSRETNIFFGNNAQGKTNILEAVSMFASGKSYRRVSDKNLIKYDSDFARIKVDFNTSGTDKTAEIIIFKGKNKLIRLNGVNLSKTSELLGEFKCVVFSPEEMFLINGAPELRRNFLDLFLSSQKPLYYNTIKSYFRILKQKNNLLKSMTEKNAETLDIWNEKLAENGAKIMIYRREIIEMLDKKADTSYRKIANNREGLKITYKPCIQENIYGEKEIREYFFDMLQRKKQAEILAGTSLVGIHRDDMEFFINGKNARDFASQGQQRTAVIALKMAQSEVIKDQSGEYPVFLFDDVMSELDSVRRNFIANEIKNNQVIITSTDKYETKKNEKYFFVENGTVREAM